MTKPVSSNLNIYNDNLSMKGYLGLHRGKYSKNSIVKWLKNNKILKTNNKLDSSKLAQIMGNKKIKEHNQTHALCLAIKEHIDANNKREGPTVTGYIPVWSELMDIKNIVSPDDISRIDFLAEGFFEKLENKNNIPLAYPQDNTGGKNTETLRAFNIVKALGVNKTPMKIIDQVKEGGKKLNLENPETCFTYFVLLENLQRQFKNNPARTKINIPSLRKNFARYDQQDGLN